MYEIISAYVMDNRKLTEYEGNYYCGELNAFRGIALKKKRLCMLAGKGQTKYLVPTKKDIFMIPSLPVNIIFTRNKRNQISGFAISTDRARNLCFVKKRSRKKQERR